jgi:hypothetical protein
MASLPLTRMTAMPLVPNAVLMAQIVSSCNNILRIPVEFSHKDTIFFANLQIYLYLCSIFDEF